MTLKKRGLGRGLEALLSDVSVKDDSKDAGDRVTSGNTQRGVIDFQDSTEQPLLSADSAITHDQADMAVALIKNIHRERLNLLEEAEAFKKLIDEFELIVRADLLQE